MRFANKSEVLNYFTNIINEDATDIDVEIKLPPTPVCGCDTLVEANLSFLASAPKVKAKLTETDNIIYVDNAEYMQGCCGTGKITVLGKEVLLNMCESDGHLNVNISIALNETTYYNVPFNVKLKNNSDITLEINKASLK